MYGVKKGGRETGRVNFFIICLVFFSLTWEVGGLTGFRKVDPGWVVIKVEWTGLEG